MSESELIALFGRHGYICVRTIGLYCAFRPEDILEGKQIKDGAGYMASVSEYALPDFNVEKIDTWLASIATSERQTILWDVSQPYTVLPEKKAPLPEWRGWEITYVRERLGIEPKADASMDLTTFNTEWRRMRQPITITWNFSPDSTGHVVEGSVAREIKEEDD